MKDINKAGQKEEENETTKQKPLRTKLTKSE